LCKQVRIEFAYLTFKKLRSTNSLLTTETDDPEKQEEQIRPTIPSDPKNEEAEANLLKINALAKKPPFCCYLKNRKHDPL